MQQRIKLEEKRLRAPHPAHIESTTFSTARRLPSHPPSASTVSPPPFVSLRPTLRNVGCSRRHTTPEPLRTRTAFQIISRESSVTRLECIAEYGVCSSPPMLPAAVQLEASSFERELSMGRRHLAAQGSVLLRAGPCMPCCHGPRDVWTRARHAYKVSPVTQLAPLALPANTHAQSS